MTFEKVAINGQNLKKLAHKKSNWRKWWRKKKNPSANPDMYKVNDVTDWSSQTTDNSKYFVWSPGLR